MVLSLAEQAARWLAGYAVIGSLFAATWLVLGLLRPVSTQPSMTWPARLLVLPGQMLLWPRLCGRWLRSRPPA